VLSGSAGGAGWKLVRWLPCSIKNFEEGYDVMGGVWLNDARVRAAFLKPHPNRPLARGGGCSGHRSDHKARSAPHCPGGRSCLVSKMNRGRFIFSVFTHQK
jgi:hypothetical protein